MAVLESRSISLWKAHAVHQLSEPWIGTQLVYVRIELQQDQITITLVVRLIEPLKRMLMVAQPGIYSRYQVRKLVSLIRFDLKLLHNI